MPTKPTTQVTDQPLRPGREKSPNPPFCLCIWLILVESLWPHSLFVKLNHFVPLLAGPQIAKDVTIPYLYTWTIGVGRGGPDEHVACTRPDDRRQTRRTTQVADEPDDVLHTFPRLSSARVDTVLLRQDWHPSGIIEISHRRERSTDRRAGCRVSGVSFPGCDAGTKGTLK